MPELHGTALFLFRRDLRLPDNIGLARALERSRRVVAAFVFDPRQAEGENRYFARNAFGFLLASLAELAGDVAAGGGRLHLFRGLPHRVVERLVAEAGVDAVFANRDYTPFSVRRDREIAEVCRHRGLPFELAGDSLLTEPEEVATAGGSPYKVFTPFFRAAAARPVAAPRPLPEGHLAALELPFASPLSLLDELTGETAPEPRIHPGRRAAQAILGHLGDLASHAAERDRPDREATTGLSAHLKLGTASVREIHREIARALGEDSPFLRQLYWRDFFTHLAYHFPRVFGRAFQEVFEGVAWDEDEARFGVWCRGETGFPLVDAGMRELLRTGWMHNRARLVTASFLTKDLHLDWRRGERHFAQHLLDYDPAVNNGNWQWAASTGADAQPWFRIFNPWRQQERFDPEARYVRRWVPELAHLSAGEIHRLGQRRPPGLAGYPPPIVDHRREALEAERRFREARRG